MSSTLSLFRQYLRTIRAIPVPAVRKKMAYNIRELFEIYRDAPPSKAADVVMESVHDMALLREILKGDRAEVFSLFKTFENQDESAENLQKQILPL